MTASWQTDVEAGHEWAEGLIRQTANARAWPVSVEDQALDIAETALPSGFTGWFADPQDYYAELAALWSSDAPSNPPNGWNELGITWASAGDASYTAAEEARLGSPVTLVTDTVSASGSDLATAGQSGLDFFSPTKGWLDPSGYKFWMPVGAIGVGLWLWKK